MSEHLRSFLKEAPEDFQLRNECGKGNHFYKYYLRGKGCLLGVLFEDSVNIYFEWVLENERHVPYGPELRYRFWPKRDFVRLLEAGIWEPTTAMKTAA